jgi:hypothetical protein
MWPLLSLFASPFASEKPIAKSSALDTRTQLLFQLEHPSYRANDTVCLSASIATTYVSKEILRDDAKNMSSSFSSTSSSIKEISFVSKQELHQYTTSSSQMVPTFKWVDVQSLRFTIQGHLHLLRPTFKIFGKSASFQSVITLYNSSPQVIQPKNKGDTHIHVPSTTDLVFFHLPSNLSPTYSGNYFAICYTVNIQFCNSSKEEIGLVRIPLLLRGVSEANNDGIASCIKTVPFVPHRLFHSHVQDGAVTACAIEMNDIATDTSSNIRSNTSTESTAPTVDSKHGQSISISHLRVCSHEDEVVEIDDLNQIPRNQQRLNDTITFCAKTTSDKQEVFITLYNTLPRASESIAIRFDFVESVCDFVCVALLQHEEISKQIIDEGVDKSEEQVNNNTTSGQQTQTKTSTLASWHETTTNVLSSWCSLNVPEDTITFDMSSKIDQTKETFMAAIKHTIKFQFNLNGTNTPLTCEVPIVISNEWRPPLVAGLSFSNNSSVDLGATRWCLLD